MVSADWSSQVNAENSRKVQLQLFFPWGLPGLEDYHEFTLNLLGEDVPFCFLQAVRQPEIGLLLVNPYVFFASYDFALSAEIAGQMEIENENQVVVFCTVNTSRGFEAATVNLLAPVVINKDKMLAKQVPLNDQRYSLRTPLNSGVKKEEG